MDEILAEALIWRLVVQTCNCGTQGLKASDHEPHCEISQAIGRHEGYTKDADQWREYRTGERNRKRFGNLPTLPPSSGGLTPAEVQGIVAATLAQFANLHGIKLSGSAAPGTPIPVTDPSVTAGEDELIDAVGKPIPAVARLARAPGAATTSTPAPTIPAKGNQRGKKGRALKGAARHIA